MNKFCPKCGKETSRLVGSLCKDCFLKEKKPAEISKEIVFEQCKACSKVTFKRKWLESSAELLEALVLQALKNKMFDSFTSRIDFFEKPDGWKAVVEVNGIVQGVKISQVLETFLKPKIVLCDACMRLKSNYFEATIQVRYSSRPSEKEVRERLEEASVFLERLKVSDSLAQIAKVKELKNGFDLLIGSKRAAKQLAGFLARKSREKVKVSSTLAGIDKNGHEWSRFTYCVRL